MLKSNVFEASVTEMHSVILLEKEVFPFIEKGHDRVMVQISFNDKLLKLHASLKKRAGFYRATLNKQQQKELGLGESDFFKVQLIEDTSKYGVEMPEEFQVVLETDQAAKDAFNSLTIGKQRTIIYMILRYKNSQTKIDKSLIIANNLKRGITDNKLILKA